MCFFARNVVSRITAKILVYSRRNHKQQLNPDLDGWIVVATWAGGARQIYVFSADP
jgi:hypothetical protein